MNSRIAPPPSISPSLPQLPGWTLSRGREPSELDTAFAAGIALKSLDDLVRSTPAWTGCWRARQALKCAAAAVRLMGRNEDEHALRDALLLTAADDDPGPAGRAFLAFKRLSARKPGFSSKSVAEFAELLDLSFDDSLAEVVDLADAALQSVRPAGPLRRGGPGDGNPRYPSECRAARLDAGGHADRRSAEMGFCRAFADGRALWVCFQDAWGQGPRPPGGTGLARCLPCPCRGNRRGPAHRRRDCAARRDAAHRGDQGPDQGRWRGHPSAA
ncbi:DUF1403 family protein [Sinorhizobium meliloti]|nr:DUF1403 family protein [Sinorhizobium meliloti]RVH08726.1 DUF1403 family protein [Sinorhizobium meliloti]RVN85943.1 DUF1403 family protein [Sinorhizobium meliloti]RVO58301.1 DUF1403 family protein [Sinorhizobium meliloti]